MAARALRPGPQLPQRPKPDVQPRGRLTLAAPLRQTTTAVTKAPAKAYNPLFIYGESGLGKTHLLHAIGHYARSLYPGTRVRYMSSEEFTNEFINSIRDGKGDSFRKRYREMDILLVDDIQFLADLSLPKIGALFGSHDHTTVMHADRKIRNLMAERRSIYNQVTEFTNRIKNG